MEAMETSIERPRSARRAKAEAETERILRLFGGLEAIRKSLGMSRRQICEELLVDPSCWTRWTKDEHSAPPHIIKMLALLVEQQSRKIISAAKAESGTDFAPPTDGRIENLMLRLEQLESNYDKKQELTLGWKLLAIINVLLLIYVIFS